jgi:hypothetical protein
LLATNSTGTSGTIGRSQSMQYRIPAGDTRALVATRGDELIKLISDSGLDVRYQQHGDVRHDMPG